MPSDQHYDAADGRARLHHELKNPLAIILGRTQILRRSISRDASMNPAEQERLLDSLRIIEQEVHVLVTRIDTVQAVHYED
ncbi:MAG: histidine kinase dimerization/phospho-acceptor domain-containing protein [Thermomicrobiales bacterium]